MTDLFSKFTKLNTPKFIKGLTHGNFGTFVDGYSDSLYQNQYVVSGKLTKAELESAEFEKEIKKYNSISVRYGDSAKLVVNKLLDMNYEILGQENWMQVSNIESASVNKDEETWQGFKVVNYANYDKFAETLEQFFADSDSFKFYLQRIKSAILQNSQGELFSIYMIGGEKPESVLGFLYDAKGEVGQILFAYDVSEMVYDHYTKLISKVLIDAKAIGLKNVFTIGVGGLSEWNLLAKLGFRLEDFYVNLVKSQ